MSEQRNLIIAIALSVAILLGFQLFYERPRLEKAQQAAQQQSQSQAVQPQAGSSKPAISSAPSAPGTPVTSDAVKTASRAEALAASPRVRIDTRRLHGSIALKGGRLDDLTLADYHETVDKKSPEITLLSPTGSAEPYYADFGWTAAPDAKLTLPGPDTVWKASGSVLTPGNPIVLTWDNGQGLRFKRTFAVDQNFLFTVTQDVENTGTAPVTLFAYGLVSRHGTPSSQGLYILHEGPVGVLKGSLAEHSYKDLVEKKRISEPSTGGWIGFTDKYWLTALIPDQKREYTASFSHAADPVLKDKYQADYLAGAREVPPGGKAEAVNRLFAGAKEVQLLERYEDEHGITRFDLAIDWGWFYFLTKPIFYAIDFFNKLIGNFGLAILLTTGIIKILFLPLAHKSYVAMSKMKLLQPEMVKLRERYGEDRNKLNQEMMALYKRAKVNPAAGCLPIVLQIPVFFSLYKVLYITIEMRHAPFFGWIRDLSSPDPTTWINLFGLLPFAPPNLGPLHVISIGVWPLLMGISMFLQQRLNPQPADPVQAKVFMLMPIMFTFMLGQFAAGLVIYWTWNNMLSMAQQWLIMKRMKVKT